MGELFDQDRNPAEFDPPPLWARQLDNRIARRFDRLTVLVQTNQEAIMATIDELNTAVAAAAQALTDLAARASSPVPQATLDAVNALSTQAAAIDPAPAAPAPPPPPPAG